MTTLDKLRARFVRSRRAITVVSSVAIGVFASRLFISSDTLANVAFLCGAVLGLYISDIMADCEALTWATHDRNRLSMSEPDADQARAVTYRKFADRGTEAMVGLAFALGFIGVLLHIANR
jgi:hypothetical protein